MDITDHTSLEKARMDGNGSLFYRKMRKGRAGHWFPADYNEYQIRYYTAEGERFGWYVFHPLPDPDPGSIKDTSVRIRYREEKPWEFEAVRRV